jgi:hypothetical protein
MTMSNPKPPSPEVIDALRRGKRALHESHRALPLSEKVRMVIELQAIALPLIARRRPLRYYERQWPDG